MKNYISPTTTHYPINTTHTLCASGTPKSGIVTFGVRVDNSQPIDIEL